MTPAENLPRRDPRVDAFTAALPDWQQDNNRAGGWRKLKLG